jgi:uncharacterized protein
MERTMRWEDLPQSDNVEDRRGEDGGSGGGGLPIGGGLGIGTIVVLGLIGWALGIDPRLLIGGAEMLSGGQRQEAPVDPGTRHTGTPNDQMGRFVASVLGSTEVQWRDIFTKAGRSYRAPTLVLYSGATQAGCGFAQSAMGPFYCPNDQKVYLDTSFFREVETRFHGCEGQSCQFVQAYIIAHEVGHHVQQQLGVLQKVNETQRAVDKPQANRLQVRIELQADCFAGVWANHAEEQWKLIQPGDVEAALRTAAAIGDDRLQKQTRGYVVPDSFTHGTSEQRQHWFQTGLREGTIGSCNTFAAQQL